MVKTILFDVDGVVLMPRDKYFSQRLKEAGYQVNEESISAFFKNQYKQIIVGKLDLKEEVSKVMHDWGWHGSVGDLLEFWFAYENKINQEVIDFVRELRAKGIKCYLASDHSKYRENDLLNNVGLVKYFDGAFFSASVGFTKEESEYFKEVLRKLDIKPEDILFIDDDPENVKIAKEVLPNAFVYTSIKDLKEEIHV